MRKKIKEKTITFLCWTEKYTKTDMVYLAKGGFWILSSQFLIAIFAFAITWFLTNFLPKEIFGEYRFLISLIPLLAIFTFLNMGNAITQSVARNFKANLHQILKTKIKYGLIGSLISLIISFYFWQVNKIDLAQSFLIIALFIPFFETFSIYTFYYKGLQNFKIPAIYESIARFIQAGAIILTVYLTTNLAIILTIYFLALILSNAFFYFYSQKYFFQTTKNRIDDSKEIIKYGKSLLKIDFLGVMANNTDKFLIWFFLGPIMLAGYAVALTIPLTIAAFFQFLPQLFLPKFSQNNYQDPKIKKIFFKKIKTFALFLLLIPIFYIPTAPFIMQLFFPTYPESILLTQIMSIILIFIILNTLLWQILLAKKEQKKMNWILITALLSQIISFLILKNYWENLAMIFAIGVYQLTILLLVLWKIK